MSPSSSRLKNLKLSPARAAAKRIFDKALNKRKRKVKFHKTVQKKDITPLIDKIADRIRLPSDTFNGGDPALSFTEVTDQSIQSIVKTPPRTISSPIAQKKPGRRSNLFIKKMSGSIKNAFFSPRVAAKRSEPSLPDDEDADVLFVSEVICSRKTSSAHSSQEPINSILSNSTYDDPIVMDEKMPPAPAKTQLWIDAFLPKEASDIIHGPPMDIFKDWLKSWKKRLTKLAKAENEPPKKKRRSRKHENDDSDYELELETSELCSTFVLSGPTGCGKTSLVYFYAKEYGFNVIELSASDERSGSVMRNKLQGAIENFGVRGPGDIRSSMFGPRKFNNDSLKHNIVLIDDADVVFKSDLYFWTRLSQFSMESKIPIVLTCTNKRLVVGSLENSEYETDHFLKREKNIIARHLTQWISDYSGDSIDKNVVKSVVQESNQDIRKALNTLQFYGGNLPGDEETSTKFTLSSRSLAELDCVLTKCNEYEKNVKVRWNARIVSNIDYVPDKSPLSTYDIPSVDNNNEMFIDDISKMLKSSLPSSFKEYDKMDERLSTNLQSCRSFSAPILPAFYDAFKRSERFSSIKNVALYELPVLAAINRGWTARLKDQPSRRRILHPFNDVDINTLKALDRFGNLCKTIDEYSSWS